MTRSGVLALLTVLALTSCALHGVYVDHEVIRVRVVRIWTDQEMIDDWQDHLRVLAGAPPLSPYLVDYRRDTVFLGYAGRGNRYEYAVAPANAPLGVGDVVELDVGARSHGPRAFDDLPAVVTLVCRAADHECLADPKRGASLGTIRY